MNSDGLKPAQAGPGTEETRARPRPRWWFCTEASGHLNNR
jgi:hypothetical protein